MKNPKRNPESGQALVFGTLTLFVTLGVMSLVVDLGLAFYKVAQGQSAADAAAMSAAVSALNNGHTCGQNGVVCGSVYQCASPPVTPATTDLQVGCLYASSNGFVNSGNQSVWLTADSSAPPGSNNSKVVYWVQASVGQTIPGLFSLSQAGPPSLAGMLLLSIHTSSSSAVSTAAITITPSSSCIYAIDTGDTAGAFSVSGSASVTSACGIFVNSSSSSAVTFNGSAVVNASQISVHGGYSTNNKASVYPTPSTGAATLTDPLATIPAPTFSGCDYISWKWSSSTNITLNPGVYCGGITLNGTGTATFNPGIYIINGGGFNWGGSAAVTGARVMFYITGSASYAAAPLNASGNGSINLSAPDQGTYEGLLFFQDRTVSYSTANTWNGNSSSNTSGAFYFPTTALTYSGSSTGRYQALIAKTISMTGNSNFLNDPSGSYTALAVKTAALIQ